MRRLNVIGLNSGTSMDGIDAALFSIAPHKNGALSASHVPNLEIALVHSILEPFEGEFQRKLHGVVAAQSVPWQDVCLLNTALGEVFAAAALRLMRECRDKVERVDLIGSHGQTIWHAPNPRPFWGVTTAGTLQLGEPAIIAARTGVPVVADFRTADVAAGGEGAPLVCFADQVLFGAGGVPTGVLNIGGIANITAIDGGGTAVMAFDTGPGNMVIDRAAQRLADRPFDEGGRLGGKGKVDESWLAELMGNRYFRRSPPKTTGRELFGVAYADDVIHQATDRGLVPVDSIATITALTAQSIAQAYSDFVQPRVKIERLVVGGGGAENKFLLEQIAQRWPHRLSIHRHEEFGISTKFKESLLFALLAYTTFYKVPNNVPACTGARFRVALGKLILPPRAG